MITKRLHLNINGKEETVEIHYTLLSWNGMAAYRRTGLTNATWYTEYNRHKKCAIIDNRAPKWYIELMALNEMLFGGQLDYLMPDLRAGCYRCHDIEAFIADLAGEHRNEYILARLAVYDEFTEKNVFLQRSRDEVMFARWMLAGLERDEG